MTDNFRDNEELNRFELDVDGTIAFVTYRKSPGAITLVHTDVPPELGGRGIGSKLGRATLDAVRAQGRKLSVECDFIRNYMTKHAEYDDLLADGDASCIREPESACRIDGAGRQRLVHGEPVQPHGEAECAAHREGRLL